MQRLEPETWGQGVTYERYRSEVEQNQETFDEAYAAPAIETADLAFLAKLPPHRILALVEDWCPDVFHTLPTWARLSEELSSWELGVFPLSEHTALMEPFVGVGGSRRVPVYAFYNETGWLQAWWSGRCGAAEREVEKILGGRTFVELDTEERVQAGRRLQDAYRKRLRRSAFDEILTLLASFYHLDR